MWLSYTINDQKCLAGIGPGKVTEYALPPSSGLPSPSVVATSYTEPAPTCGNRDDLPITDDDGALFDDYSSAIDDPSFGDDEILGEREITANETCGIVNLNRAGLIFYFGPVT